MLVYPIQPPLSTPSPRHRPVEPQGGRGGQFWQRQRGILGEGKELREGVRGQRFVALDGPVLLGGWDINSIFLRYQQYFCDDNIGVPNS